MLIVYYILYGILALYIAYVLYFIIGWLRTSTKTDFSPNRFPTVSVIIPVRNEEKHIEKLLRSIQAQTYPADKFDVIVIDDYSTDNTVSIIHSLNIPNVKVVPLKVEGEIYAYKKMAITTGVNSSNAELIVSTDGDCSMDKHWLSSIVSFYTSHSYKLISSPVAFHQEKTWFEKIQTVEFQYLIGVGAACMRNGMPSTCNGANLAYTRELFHEINGFEGIDDIAFGDDELLLHKVYKQHPNGVGFNKNRNSIVYTYAKSNLNEFVEQRKRWAKKNANYFDTRLLAMVMSVFLVNLVLFFAIPFSFIYHELQQDVFKIFLIKLMFDGIFMFMLLKFFQKAWYIIFAPVVIFLYIFYFVYLGIIGNVGTTYLWKGRKVI